MANILVFNPERSVSTTGSTVKDFVTVDEFINLHPWFPEDKLKKQLANRQHIDLQPQVQIIEKQPHINHRGYISWLDDKNGDVIRDIGRRNHLYDNKE
jgi:hypothetical protein